MDTADAEVRSESARINDWLQVAALFGVIASLLFVGLQMKQQQEIALSVATQARTETTIQAINAQFANPYYMSAMDKMEAGDPEALTASERRAIYFLGMAVLLNFENVHYQFLNGFVPEERWVGTKETLKGVLMQPGGAADTYRANPGAWRVTFQEVVDGLLAEIEAEAGSG